MVENRNREAARIQEESCRVTRIAILLVHCRRWSSGAPIPLVCELLRFITNAIFFYFLKLCQAKSLVSGLIPEDGPLAHRRQGKHYSPVLRGTGQSLDFAEERHEIAARPSRS